MYMIARVYMPYRPSSKNTQDFKNAACLLGLDFKDIFSTTQCASQNRALFLNFEGILLQAMPWCLLWWNAGHLGGEKGLKSHGALAISCLSEFSITAVTNDDKFNDLKQHKHINLQLRRLEVCHVSHY